LADATRHQVPQRDVDAGDALIERPGLSRLYRQYRGAPRKVIEHFDRIGEGARLQHRSEYRIQQPCPVLGPARGEVAPDLTPASEPILILDANEQRRPVAHDAERRSHRRVDRIAVHLRLDAAQAHAVECRRIARSECCHGRMSISSRTKSPR
jgi:hypothetical protein